jgi:carboxymethylenebutenolidase
MRNPLLACFLLLITACSRPGADPSLQPAGGPAPGMLPASAAEVEARLAASPRHAEWVTVRVGPVDSVRAWVVYPERSGPAPVVLVVHEIFGLSHWIRGVADQLAADGFIAIAPDMLTMRGIPAGADGAPDADAARSEIQTLDRGAIHQQLLAVAEYGMSLPAAQPRYGIIGFCWGGTVAFEHAIRSPALGASVVFYGSSPDSNLMGSIRAPILGLYGENDARVNATIPAADAALRALGQRFEHELYPGAGHGFLRAQDGMDGANLSATRAAWPRTIAWLRDHLEG